MLLKDLYQEYISQKQKHLAASTLRYYRGYWRNWIAPTLADVRVAGVTRPLIQQALQECSPTQANRIVTFLSSLFKFGGISNPPTTGMRFIKEVARKRYVREDEWQILSKGLLKLDKGNRGQKQLALYVRFLLFTGVRRDEAEQARYEDVDFKRGTLLVSGKTGQREVALTPILLESLDSSRSGFIFPATKSKTKGKNFSYAWKQFVNSIGLPELKRHDLRRTFGVTGLNNGLSLEEIQALLGHSSIVTTQKSYAWLLTDAKKKAATRMEATLMRNLA